MKKIYIYFEDILFNPLIRSLVIESVRFVLLYLKHSSCFGKWKMILFH